MTGRFAVYLAPARDSPLHLRASAWLGRDAWSGTTMIQPSVDGLTPDRLHDLTASPRRYGFHATVKAPFTLAQGYSVEQLAQALGALAAEVEPFTLPLELSAPGGFLALVPASNSPPMRALEERCVVELDHFRAPTSPSELARRRSVGLSDTAEANLERFGYPWVISLFRYHMSLSERLSDDDLATLRRAVLRQLGDALIPPLSVDSLCLFHEPEPGAAMRGILRVPLGATREASA